MRTRIWTALVVLGAMLASCGGEDTTGPPPDTGVPRVSYFPTPGELVLVAYDSVTLSVAVSPSQPFTVQYALDDSILDTEGPELIVHGDKVGTRRYTATVHVGEYWYDDDWDVRIVSEAELPTPAPSAPSAEPGSLPGTVVLHWDRPPDRTIEVPLIGFEIAWSVLPFEGTEFDAQTIVSVADNPVGIRQTGEVAALGEREEYFFRIRSVDELDRRSHPTSQVFSQSTGSFQLSGTLLQLDENGWPRGVGSALISAGPQRQTTGLDGRFVLSGLPDVEPLVLRAEEGSGRYTLPILTTPLNTVDRELDLLLVPQQRVDILDEGVVSESTLREFLLDATLNSNPTFSPAFHPWPSYPVKVWVWEYVGEGSEAPSFHGAFARAIDLWNDGATGGERLLEYVAVDDSLFDPANEPGSVGVYVRFYPNGSSNLGEVNFVSPANGRVGAHDPKLLVIKLRRSLPTQTLVDRVVAHEIGHTIGLVHTPSETNLMHMASDLSQGIPTPEEIFVGRYIRHGGKDMLASWILEQ
jgi:hypothetical protein